jgi:hypothetical protein
VKNFGSSSEETDRWSEGTGTRDFRIWWNGRLGMIKNGVKAIMRLMFRGSGLQRHMKLFINGFGMKVCKETKNTIFGK